MLTFIPSWWIHRGPGGLIALLGSCEPESAETIVEGLLLAGGLQMILEVLCLRGGMLEGTLARGRRLIELRELEKEVESNEIAGGILLDKLSRDITEVREMLGGALAEGRSLMELRASEKEMKSKELAE